MSDSDLVHNDDDLIAKARSDPAAFAELYRRNYAPVFRYCAHRLFLRAVAEDITSTVFLRMVEHIDRFEGNERSLRHWLYRIATNLINQYLRSSAQRKRIMTLMAMNYDESGPDPGLEKEKDEMTARVKKALLELKPKYQAVIALHYFEGLKLTEIAEILGRGPGTVRSQLSRALATLRKKLSAEIGPDGWEIK